MKPIRVLQLLGIGAIAATAILASTQPSFAKKKVIVTTTPGNATNNAVVPTIPLGAPAPVAPPPSGGLCAQGPAPCLAPAPPVQTVSKDYFFCGAGAHGLPTTFVNTPTGNIPLIRWNSNYFEQSGYSPGVRCQDVSQRFNRFYNQGVLNYVTTGYVNSLPVVCVASDIGGPCTGVLFTLKPGENATRAIQQLFDVRAGASGPLYESESRPYIDMKQYTQALR